MVTKSSRKLICFLLSLLMVFGICIFTGSTLVRATLCYKDYMEMFISSNKVSAYCDSSYNARIAVLAENSGIPVRVFEAAGDISGYSETVVSRFYSGSDTTIFTQDKIESYERLIKEYLDGNEISYNEAWIHSTAIKAAEIYSDSYGMKNLDSLKAFVDDVISNYGRISSGGLAIVMIAAALIYAMYSDNKKTVKYYTGIFTASGLSFIFIGLTGIIVFRDRGGNITPAIYSNAIFSAVDFMLVILIVLGILVTAVSTTASLRHNKLTKKTRNR